MTCELWLVTCDLWLVTCDLWLVTCDLWLVTCNLWLVTCNWSKKAVNRAMAEQNGRTADSFFAIFLTVHYNSSRLKII